MDLGNLGNKADELTAHIVDGRSRERVRKNLLKHLQDLEQICEHNEDDEFVGEDDGHDYSKHDDGVPVISFHELLNRVRSKSDTIEEIWEEATADKDAEEPTDEEKAKESVNRLGKFGMTPIIAVIVNEALSPDERLEQVKDLIVRGADLSIRDSSGKTPLARAQMRSSEPGMKQIINLLL